MDNERTIKFVIEGERVEVTRKYGTDREQVSVDLEKVPAGATVISFSGVTSGSSGQCQDAIRQMGEDAGDWEVTELCDLWDRWHLNDMRAGTKCQIACLERNGPGKSYDENLEILEAEDLRVDDGYVYGTDWLYEPIPQKIIDRIEWLMGRLDGQWVGEEPDVDYAPDLDGDIIDSRDVIQAFEIYQRAVAVSGFDPEKVKLEDAETSEFRDIVSEFLHIRELVNDAEGAADWEYGETLIAEDYFTEYAKELADDLGEVNRDTRWPNTHIDWDAAANELKMDYTSIEFKGKTYLIRS